APKREENPPLRPPAKSPPDQVTVDPELPHVRNLDNIGLRRNIVLENRSALVVDHLTEADHVWTTAQPTVKRGELVFANRAGSSSAGCLLRDRRTSRCGSTG